MKKPGWEVHNRPTVEKVLFAKNPVFARYCFFPECLHTCLGFQKKYNCEIWSTEDEGNFFPTKTSSTHFRCPNAQKYFPSSSFLFFFARMSEGVRDWRQRRKGGGENPFGASAAAAEEDGEEVEEGLGTKRKEEEDRETGQK